MQIDEWVAYSSSSLFSDQNAYKVYQIWSYRHQVMNLAKFITFSSDLKSDPNLVVQKLK
jgi:hypothetical protein